MQSVKYFLTTGAVLSSKLTSDKNRYKHVSFNFDTNINLLEDGLFTESHAAWRVKNRMPFILSALTDFYNSGVELFSLQEGRHFFKANGEEVDSINPIVNHMKSMGLNVHEQQYNPSDRAFSYITAWNPSRFDLKDTKIKYFTQTPDKPTEHPDTTGMSEEQIKEIDTKIKDNNYGEYWERCFVIYHLFDKQTDSDVALVNVHLGIVLNHRLKAAEIVRETAEQMKKENPKLRIIITGDFNTFPDWGGPEQLEKLSGSVLTEATKKLKLPNGELTDSSFISPPYDFAAMATKLDMRNVIKEVSLESKRHLVKKLFEHVCFARGGHLDRVFYSGFSTGESFLVPTPQFEEGLNINYNSEKEVKEFIMKHIDGPCFASDHQPVLSFFSF